jgi:ankyrin repeat protein
MFRTTLIAAAFVTFGMPALAADCADWIKHDFFETASVDEVAACLAAGADINARDSVGSTPLHGAAKYSKTPVVIEVLLAAGADVNARNVFGGAPLHDAAYQNANLAIIEAFLAAGADVNARDVIGGATPLHMAALKTENPAVVEALIAAGADIAAVYLNRDLPFDMAQRNEHIKGTNVYWVLNEGRFK